MRSPPGGDRPCCGPRGWTAARWTARGIPAVYDWFRSSGVITRRRLNRATLARQGLLERGPGGPCLRIRPAHRRDPGAVRARDVPRTVVARCPTSSGTRSLEELEARSVVQATLPALRPSISSCPPRTSGPGRSPCAGLRREGFLPRPARRAGRGGRWPAPARRLRARLARRAAAPAGDRCAAGQGGGRAASALWLDLVRVPPSGHLGAAPGRPLRPRRGLASPAATTSRRTCASSTWARSHLKRVRSRSPARHRELGRPQGRRPSAPALERMTLRRFRGPDGDELLDLPDGVLPDRGGARPRPASSLRGTRRCSSTPAARRSCPRSTARACSASATRTASPPSSSTGRWRALGGWTVVARSSSPSAASTPPTCTPSRPGRAPRRLRGVDHRLGPAA